MYNENQDILYRDLKRCPEKEEGGIRSTFGF